MEKNMYSPEKYFKNNGHIEGNFASVEFNIWEGFTNELEFINYMYKEGWMFVSLDKHYIHGRGACIAESTFAEVLFKRLKQNDKN